ncbi:MAG: hypothetical protein V2I76_06620 [Roseobacter sp.]|jgi:hypothetical protein|nr:hypothetical protein [Roseobacter sp.]
MENAPATTIFDVLIWTGAFISLTGLVGLVWCIIFVARARRAKLSDEDLRARVRKAVPINLGALFLSVIGLMLVVIGIFLA